MGHPVRALKVQKAASLPQAASPFPGLYWAGARANIPAPGGTSSMLQQSGVQGSDGLGALSGHTLGGMPEEKRPDIRPQLRDFLAWYEEVLGRIESGAIVAPGGRLRKRMVCQAEFSREPGHPGSPELLPSGAWRTGLEECGEPVDAADPP